MSSKLPLLYESDFRSHVEGTRRSPWRGGVRPGCYLVFFTSCGSWIARRNVRLGIEHRCSDCVLGSSPCPFSCSNRPAGCREHANDRLERLLFILRSSWLGYLLGRDNRRGPRSQNMRKGSTQKGVWCRGTKEVGV